MKEIDFTPEWYKQGRLQQEKHREFYVAIGLIVFIMAAWGIFANGRAAAARAKNISLQNYSITQQAGEIEYSKVKTEYEQLEARNQEIGSIKSHIVVSNVIAELTQLLDGGVILKKLNIKAEPISELDIKTDVTTAGTKDQASQFAKKMKFKITLNGLAADSTQVAEIINKLEQSKYFFQIVLNYSKNMTIKQQYQASEFEIVCYLANYKLTNQ